MSVYVSRRRPIGPGAHILMITLTVVIGAAGIFGMVFATMAWTLDQPVEGFHRGVKSLPKAPPLFKSEPTQTRKTV